MYEPRFLDHNESSFSFLDFIRGVRESNFVRFVLFVSCLSFSVNVASPFFAVFMLRDLKFNYLTYTIVVIPVVLTTLLLIDRWGRLADRIGNIRVLKFTSFFIAILPLFWIIYYHPVYLIFVQILSGFAWSGFNLCATNFIFDSVSVPKRTRCHSYFNVINGLGLSTGAILGGYLAVALPKMFGHRLLFLFFLSAALRFLTILIFRSKIKEVRAQVEAVRGKDIIRELLKNAKIKE